MTKVEQLEALAAVLRFDTLDAVTLEHTGGGCFVLFVQCDPITKIGIDMDTVVGYEYNNETGEWDEPHSIEITGNDDMNFIIHEINRMRRLLNVN